MLFFPQPLDPLCLCHVTAVFGWVLMLTRHTAGGLWMPEAPALARMRQSVDRHPERLKAVLMEARLRREFLKGAPSVEPKAVKAFCAQNADSALKTKPKVSYPQFSYLSLEQCLESRVSQATTTPKDSCDLSGSVWWQRQACLAVYRQPKTRSRETNAAAPLEGRLAK